MVSSGEVGPGRRRRGGGPPAEDVSRMAEAASHVLSCVG